MKQDMKKRLRIFLALACVMLLCAACGVKEPPENEPEDWSGVYTDKQGTTDVYSELVLSRNEDGTYAVSVSLYRLLGLEGMAEDVDGTLHFDCYVPDIHVAGDITIDSETAELVITESDTYLLEPGMVYRFPDGE